MSDLKSLLQEKIKENRPNLGPSSIKTYISILSNLYKKLNGDGNIEWFERENNEILKHLDDKNDQTRKTTLSFAFDHFYRLNISVSHYFLSHTILYFPRLSFFCKDLRV